MRSISSCRFKIAIIVALMLLCLAAVPHAFAQKTYPNINTEELKSMLDKKDKVVLIDSRTQPEYAESHIVTAVNIPDKKLQENLTLLPAEKSSLLVIYCNGVKCGKSKRLAVLLEPLGYTNIRIYLEGIPVWEEKNLPLVTGPDYNKKIEATIIKPVDLKKMIDEERQDFVVVDVRDLAEFKEGHIPGAINIPSENFAAGSGVLPKEKKIIVYCNTGSRSYLAYKKLIQLAYPNINQALLADWKEVGFAVEK
ncbi:MAG: sulfurtransferase [Deltaproteobacteria bacterium HGW-Deltaproteobacteria-1]|jgi:rhodanese-related sulfurtransferase|nr:MAG: sulfurtransferase [Deltaproteobacteria bacterium HGW-Deltaproteobacteria-1]